MRFVLIAAAALLGACSVETSSGGSYNPAGGYAMQVVAAADEAQIYYVTGPDDHAAAAKVDHGVSSVIEVNEARLALGEARATVADLGEALERVTVHAPGFEFSLSGAEDDGHSDANDRAKIQLSAGGRHINIDANGGDENGHALVQITGASESDARGFINEADDLSSDTKRQMLEQLGLAEPH